MFLLRQGMRIPLLMLALAMLLFGCGGGGPSTPKPKPPDPDPPLLQGQVFGPSGLLAHRSPAHDSWATFAVRLGTLKVAARDATHLGGETPLANTPLVVYVLEDFLNSDGGGPSVGSGTTDDQGNFSIADIPPNKDLVIVVGGMDTRLSAIVPATGRSQRTATINSSTTLAAEAWAPTLKEHGSSHFPVGLDELLRDSAEAAADALSSLSESELLHALQELIPETFGQGLPDTSTAFDHVLRALEETVLEGEPACWLLELDLRTAIPTGVLRVSGLPDDWLDEETFARFDPEGLDEWVPAFIELTGGGEAELYMPVHPGNYMRGGPGQITIYKQTADGAPDVECPPFSVDILSVDPSPGTLDNIVDDLEDLLQTMAPWYGVERDAAGWSAPIGSGDMAELLASNLNALSRDGDDILRGALKSPSLTSEGRSYEMDGDALDFIEAIIAAQGVDAQLRDFTEGLKNAPSEFERNHETAGISSPMRTMAMNGPGQGFIVPPNMISTPRQLAYWMDVQNVCARTNSEVVKGVKDIVGVGLAGITVIAPPAGVVTGPVGLAMTWAQLVNDMCEELLPSQLDRLDLFVSQADFHEDDDEAAEWMAALYVQDREWLFDVPTMVGLIPGAGKGGKAIAKAQTAKRMQGAVDQAQRIVDHSEAFASWVHTTVSTIWNWEFGKTFHGPQVGPIIVDPDRDAERAYFDWKLYPQSTPAAFKLQNNDKEINPEWAGDAEFVVKTVANSFQGQEVSKEILLSVHPIEIEISEAFGQALPRYRTEPGRVLEFFADVQNAKDQNVEWSATGPVQPVEVSEQQATYTPEEPGDYILTATSLASTGPRSKPNRPERFAQVVVEVREDNHTVYPRPACLQVGDMEQFYSIPSSYFIATTESTNTDANMPQDLGEVRAAIVSGNAGRISGNGLFTAQREGHVTIRFSVEDSDWEDEITFEVKDECEGYYISLTGFENFNYEGSCIAHGRQDRYSFPSISFGNWASSDWTGTGIIGLLTVSDEYEELKAGTIDLIDHDVRDWSISTRNNSFGGFLSETITVPYLGTFHAGSPSYLKMWGEWVPTPGGFGTEFAITGTLEGLGGTRYMTDRGHIVEGIVFAKMWFYNVKDIDGSGCTQAFYRAP